MSSVPRLGLGEERAERRIVRRRQLRKFARLSTPIVPSRSLRDRSGRQAVIEARSAKLARLLRAQRRGPRLPGRTVGGVG